MRCYKLIACPLHLEIINDFFLDVRSSEDNTKYEVTTLEYVSKRHSKVRSIVIPVESVKTLIGVYG